MKLEKLMLGLVAAAALSACSSTKLDEPAKVETKEPVPTQQVPQVDPNANAQRKVETVDLGAQLDAAVSNQRVVYLEGHADERGGREYNLALGQKRAEAVAKSLTLLGVASGQVEPVSFGKERPADTGHNEEAWAKNRRVELRDK